MIMCEISLCLLHSGIARLRVSGGRLEHVSCRINAGDTADWHFKVSSDSSGLRFSASFFGSNGADVEGRCLLALDDVPAIAHGSFEAEAPGLLLFTWASVGLWSRDFEITDLGIDITCRPPSEALRKYTDSTLPWTFDEMQPEALRECDFLDWCGLSPRKSPTSRSLKSPPVKPANIPQALTEKEVSSARLKPFVSVFVLSMLLLITLVFLQADNTSQT